MKWVNEVYERPASRANSGLAFLLFLRVFATGAAPSGPSVSVFFRSKAQNAPASTNTGTRKMLLEATAIAHPRAAFHSRLCSAFSAELFERSWNQHNI